MGLAEYEKDPYHVATDFVKYYYNKLSSKDCSKLFKLYTEDSVLEHMDHLSDPFKNSYKKFRGSQEIKKYWQILNNFEHSKVLVLTLSCVENPDNSLLCTIIGEILLKEDYEIDDEIKPTRMFNQVFILQRNDKKDNYDIKSDTLTFIPDTDYIDVKETKDGETEVDEDDDDEEEEDEEENDDEEENKEKYQEEGNELQNNLDAATTSEEPLDEILTANGSGKKDSTENIQQVVVEKSKPKNADSASINSPNGAPSEMNGKPKRHSTTNLSRQNEEKSQTKALPANIALPTSTPTSSSKTISTEDNKSSISQSTNDSKSISSSPSTKPVSTSQSQSQSQSQSRASASPISKVASVSAPVSSTPIMSSWASQLGGSNSTPVIVKTQTTNSSSSSVPSKTNKKNINNNNFTNGSKNNNTENNNNKKPFVNSLEAFTVCTNCTIESEETESVLKKHFPNVVIRPLPPLNAILKFETVEERNKAVELGTINFGNSSLKIELKKPKGSKQGNKQFYK